jgi:adenosylcobinamide-GDP ribazoletransferase
MVALPYATPEHAKSRVVARAGVAQAVVATAWLAIVVAVCVAWTPLSAARLGAMMGALVIVTVATGARYRARAGGVTGDFLGATEQLCEVAALVVLAWRPR